MSIQSAHKIVGGTHFVSVQSMNPLESDGLAERLEHLDAVACLAHRKHHRVLLRDFRTLPSWCVCDYGLAPRRTCPLPNGHPSFPCQRGRDTPVFVGHVCLFDGSWCSKSPKDFPSAHTSKSASTNPVITEYAKRWSPQNGDRARRGQCTEAATNGANRSKATMNPREPKHVEPKHGVVVGPNLDVHSPGRFRRCGRRCSPRST